MSKWIVTQPEVKQLAARVAAQVIEKLHIKPGQPVKAYGIPRGGIPAAYAIAAADSRIEIIDLPHEADVFLDDVIDSGATREKWLDRYPTKPFFALVDKPSSNGRSPWVVWPWEADLEGSFEGNITRMLQFIGEDPARGGLVETPRRVARAWQFWCSGYSKDPKSVLKVFEDGAKGCDEMVLVRSIPFYSHCEHHLAPIFGTVSIAYIPDGKIVGLSKLSRLADVYARRLQVQERLTNQIADALDENLHPKGVGVLVKARHLCMESRGVCQQGHETVTSALRGVMKDDSKARAEFLSLA